MTTLAIPEKTRRDQERASDPRVSAWVDANAGAGKTHVLARRVVRLLLGGVPPGRLLCLTFTKAAAANMANRVLTTLATWTRLDDIALDMALAKVDSAPPTDERRARARRLFAQALETPGGLKVQTIHAFCDRVLHQFPFEAGVPAGFGVLADATAADLLARARDEVLLTAAAEPGSTLGAALALAVAAAGDDGIRQALDEAVKDRSAIVALTGAPGWRDACADRLARALGIDAGLTLTAVEDDMLASPHLPARDWPALARLLAESSRNDRKLGARIEAAATAGERDARIEGWLDVFLTAEGELRAEGFVTKPFCRAHPDFADAMLAERERIGELLDRRRAVRARDRSLAMLALAGEIVRRYAAAKRGRALLDFDDLVATTRALMENVGAAWVHYKLDRGIDHILIDEAQDTSAPQWAIVKALASEFFAGRGAREDTPRTIFAVGDEKQSIFGFQGAAPEMFAQTRREFAELSEGVGRKLESVPLTLSFRSTTPVLEAIDTIFARPEARDGLQAEGDDPPVHESVRTGVPGAVELWSLVEPEAAGAETDAWDRPVDEVGEEHPVVRLARRIAGHVHDWTIAGTRRRPEGEPIRAGDVMILVRRRGALFEAIIRALKDRNIPVAGADRLVLAEHIAVMDLLALGDALLAERDDLALASVLKSPLFGLDDDDLVELAARRTGTLWQALADAPRFASVNRQLLAWRDDALRLRPFDFYARLLGRDGGRRAFLRRLGEEAADPLDEFLSLAADHEMAEAPTLRGFLAFMRRGGAEVKRDMEQAGVAVRVMTVHGAKGLEAPVVVLADTTAPPDSGPRARLVRLPLGNAPAGDSDTDGRLWIPKKGDAPRAAAAAVEAEALRARREYHRLLYVALTRAAEILVVCGHAGKRRLDGTWYDLVRTALSADGVAEQDDPHGGTIRPWRTWPAMAGRADGSPSAPSAPVRPGWVDRPAALPRAAMRLRPSAAIGPAVPAARADDGGAAPDRSAALAAGLALHRLLAVLPDARRDDRAALARRLLAQWRLDAADSDRVAAQALAMLDHPRLAALFGPGSRAEVPLAGHVLTAGSEPRPVAARIDRLLVGAREVVVADFKTDSRPPAGPAELPVGHVAQLAIYAHLAGQAFPDRAISGVLVYTAGPAAIEVSASDLATAFARVTSA